MVYSIFYSSCQDNEMEKPHHDLFDGSFAFDRRSETFRQKMFEHFSVKQSLLSDDMEEILENDEPSEPPT